MTELRTAERSTGDARGPVMAALLVGGLGSRLRTVVSDRPKPIASVAGQPFLTHLLRQLEAQGIREVVLCTGYMSEKVEQAIGPRCGDLHVSYSREPKPLGTGGALRYALSLLRSDPILVLNGDSWCEFDLPTLFAWHKARRAHGSIWLSRVEDTSRFGRVVTAADGRISSFNEKGEGSGPGWVSAGVYLLSRHLIGSIPAGRAISLERDLFPKWVGGALCGYAGRGPFLDIGTPDSFSQAATFLRAKTRTVEHSPQSKRLCVLLDRDGTICAEDHYLSDPERLRLLPGAADGLRQLQANGCALVVLTNQSAIGRGYFDLERLEQIHERLRALLAAHAVTLDGIYFCPHLPEENCACRKPRAGLVYQAATALGFEPSEAIFVGDKACDIELGKALGASTVLVTTGYGKETLTDPEVRPDFVVSSLAEAARVITYRGGHNQGQCSDNNSASV